MEEVLKYYVVKTVPQGFTDQPGLSDLTATLLVTNSVGVAKSSVDGSRKPMAAFIGDVLVFSNLGRLRTVLVEKPLTPPVRRIAANRKGARDRRDFRPREDKPRHEIVVEVVS